MFHSFYKIIPDKRICVCLSIIDDVILKIKNKNIEYVIEIVHGLREKVFYMLAFEKLIRDEQQTDDDVQEFLYLLSYKCF